MSNRGDIVTPEDGLIAAKRNILGDLHETHDVLSSFLYENIKNGSFFLSVYLYA
jgi:hypothetical protein